MFAFLHPRKVTSDREVPEFNMQAKIRSTPFDCLVLRAGPPSADPAPPGLPAEAADPAPPAADGPTEGRP